MELKISFGILSPTINKQLRMQNLRFDRSEVVDYDRYKRAINDLWIGDCLLDKELEKIKLRLFKRIERHIMKQNKLTNKKVQKTCGICALNPKTKLMKYYENKSVLR